MARSQSAADTDARTPPHFGKPEGGVVMDTRIYENGSRAEKLWAALIALLIGLGVVWVIAG